MSYELRPPVPCTKGTVLADQAGGLGNACFVGDDHADIEAFEVLEGLAGSGLGVLKVAVASPEAPSELLAKADLVVAGPEGAAGLLRLMDAGCA
jgi:hydroxymethylpyrimidine pyrophosphatase-like HAD family hydrolase